MDPAGHRQPQSAGLPGPIVGRRDLITPNPKLKLLDQVREVMRLKHYSLRTERAYCDWIRRFIKFHGMRSREDLQPAEAKMELFLSDLAVNGKVAASTQNQAFNALLFLFREVVHHPLGQVQALRAERPVRVPVVLTVEEVKAVIGGMSGTPQLVVKLLYGSGLRLMEALRLRVQDLDFGMRQLTVRDGKGSKDRFTVLPETVIPALKEHLERVRRLHEKDLAEGGGSVYLPGALERKYPHAAREWGWQYVFPARGFSTAFNRLRSTLGKGRSSPCVTRRMTRLPAQARARAKAFHQRSCSSATGQLQAPSAVLMARSAPPTRPIWRAGRPRIFAWARTLPT
jgi:integron integrase